MWQKEKAHITKQIPKNGLTVVKEKGRNQMKRFWIGCHDSVVEGFWGSGELMLLSS